MDPEEAPEDGPAPAAIGTFDPGPDPLLARPWILQAWEEWGLGTVTPSRLDELLAIADEYTEAQLELAFSDMTEDPGDTRSTPERLRAFAERVRDHRRDGRPAKGAPGESLEQRQDRYGTGPPLPRTELDDNTLKKLGVTRGGKQ